MRACLSPSERQKVQKIQVERTMSEGYDRKKKKNGGDLDLFALFSDIQYSRAGTKSQLGGEVIGGHPIYSAFKTNSLVHTVQRQMEMMYHQSKDDSPIECKCYNEILAQKNSESNCSTSRRLFLSHFQLEHWASQDNRDSTNIPPRGPAHKLHGGHVVDVGEVCLQEGRA